VQQSTPDHGCLTASTRPALRGFPSWRAALSARVPGHMQN
jgi:hypothetical protein